MALSNAERQRLYIQRLKAKAVSNDKPAETAPDVSNGVTVTIGEDWREGLARSEQSLGIPADEFADFLMRLGMQAFKGNWSKRLLGLQPSWLNGSVSPLLTLPNDHSPTPPPR